MLASVRWLWVVLVMVACGRGAQPPSAQSAAGVATPSAPEEARELPPGFMNDVASVSVVSGAAPQRASSAPQPQPAAGQIAAGGLGPTQVTTTPARMLDIEAHLTIQVEDVARAADTLRRVTLENGGDVVEDSINDATSSPRAQLTFRVPSRAADDVIRKLEQVGSVTSRQVTARDVGKQYYDAELRLQSLTWALARYEQILARANTVDEILRVEQEVARVRGQIEQIKGELRYLADRAARATIYVTLLGPQAIQEQELPIVHPEAKFFPGVRLVMLSDLWGEGGNATYLGAGASLRLSRHLSLDIDGLRRANADSTGLDFFLATLGGELYSDFLGGGRRRWLNPYVGFRGGYARLAGRNEIAAGGSLGLELWKLEFITVELDARVYGMFGTSAGAHLAVQPALGANVAF